jgi:hypothetical protein
MAEQNAAVAGEIGNIVYQVKGPGYSETMKSEAAALKAYEKLKTTYARRGEAVKLTLSSRAGATGKFSVMLSCTTKEEHFE